MPFRPINTVSEKIAASLRQMDLCQNDNCRYYACGVLFHDGTIEERVLLIEEAHGIYNKEWIDLHQISAVWPSRFRIPPAIVRRIYALGESGMGCFRFTLVLRDGTRLNCLTGGFVDYPELPLGITSADIMDVIPEIATNGTVVQDATARDASYRIGYFVLP